MVKNVCFGLTAKGREVAPKYLEIIDNNEKISRVTAKAQYWYKKWKDSDYPLTYEEVFKMAMDGQL